MPTLKNIVLHPKRYMIAILRRALLFLPDKAYLIIIYKLIFGKKLDLDNPQSYNEKLQWLKLYDRNPQYTRMVDKYEAKKYVASIVGEEYIIPTLGVWDKFDDINFDKLPQQFVLKTTHDSGGVVICRDKSKFDKVAARKKMEKSLHHDYYRTSKEWPYKNVKRRIIAEKYMEDESGELKDYKFFCFDGEPRLILVCKNRFSKSGLTEDFFSCNWTHLNIRRPLHPNSETNIIPPVQLDKMISLSKQLSADISFIRTDFYEIGDKIYFGELTFFPASGFEKFVPEEWDKTLGEWLNLPKKGI